MNKEDLIKELKKYLEAISSYQGNEITHYRMFSNLMLEEQITILADIFHLILVETIVNLEKEEK